MRRLHRQTDKQTQAQVFTHEYTAGVLNILSAGASGEGRGPVLTRKIAPTTGRGPGFFLMYRSLCAP